MLWQLCILLKEENGISSEIYTHLYTHIYMHIYKDCSSREITYEIDIIFHIIGIENTKIAFCFTLL